MNIRWGKLGLILLVTFALGIGGWGIYAGLIRPTTKPNPTESQQADSIVNHNTYYQFEPHQTFGCARYNAPMPEKK
jgi:hypothetical protein